MKTKKGKVFVHLMAIAIERKRLAKLKELEELHNESITNI